MAGTELGVGYISVVASTERIPGQLRQAFSGAAGIGEAAGRDMGGRMSSALGSALKGGAIAAGAAVTGVLGAALTKGIGRLTAIDDAQGKLKGLGHDAQSTAAIMDSALDSVRGTAFGLGDAATIAASAVAAGIEPGKDLTRYLSLIGDAATIGGASLQEMGSIINQTTTSGIVFTDTLNQLADRGIPIFTWLQEEYKVTGDELRDMVSDGKVDAETFQRVIEKNIGGAALAGGETVRGAFSNMGAALGRFGAVVAGPVFNRAASGFGSVTEAIDGATAAITPFVDKFDSWLSSDGIPKAQAFGQAVADIWSEFTGSELAVGSISTLRDTFSELLTVGKDLAPSVQAIVVSLAQASAATGVSAWQVLLNTLDAIAPILDSTLVPGLEALASLMQDNQTAVTALALGFAAFKTLPAIGAMAASAFAPLRTSLAATATSTAGTRAAFAAMRGDFRNLAPQIGTVGAAMRALGNNSATIRGMQNAFIGSSTAAGGFAAAMRQGVQPALAGVRSAASGVRNLLAGGLGLGLAIVGAMQFVGAMDDMQESQDSNRDSAFRLAEAQRDVADALGKTAGAVNDDVLDALTAQMDEYRQGLERTAADAPGLWNDIVNFVMPKWDDDMSLGERWSAWWGGANDDLQEAGRIAAETSEALKELGVSNKDLAVVMAGSDAGWASFVERLRETGGASDEAVASLEAQREKLLQQQAAAEKVTPGMVELADSISVLGDSAASAEDKTSALKDALYALLGIEVPLAEAIANYEDELAGVVESSVQAADAAGGLGDALLNGSGGLDLQQQNARALQEELLGLADSYFGAVAAGGDAAELAERNGAAYDALADKYDLTRAQVEALAESFGLVPEVVESLVQLNGADAVTQELGGIALKIQEIDPDSPKTVTVLGLTEEAEDKLEKLGFSVKRNTEDQTVQVSANTEQALRELDNLTRPRDVKIRLHYEGLQAVNNRIVEDANRPSNDYYYVRYAQGGVQNLPEQARIEPGRGAGLVQWAEGETGGEAFIPLAESKRARSTAILGDVAERFGYRLEKFADGGIRRALDAATAGNGIKYVWGGTGPNGWDCSGWVGYLQQILMGATPSEAAGRRLYTTYSLLGGSTAGLQPGSGPAGTVFVVGTSDEHMAATLNGQPVESGGAHGTSRIGPPAVGAFDSQFHSIFHLPNEMIDGGTEGISGIGAYAVEREPWTEKDQLDLESARIAVQQAKEARDKTYANEKKSDADKAQADLKVQRAELKVRELENKRDGVGIASAISTEPAPPLTGDMDESAIQLRQAEISVLDAQLARDKVYNDPDSTSLDKEKADLQVHSAKNSLEETKKRIAEEEEELATGGGKDGSSGGEFSLKDRLKKFGSDVFGILVDSVIEQASPFGESRWLSIPFPDFTPPKEGETVSKKGGKKSKDSDKKPIDELSIPANFPGADEQLGFDPGQGIPKWVQQHLKKLPLKVFDTGGWLKPNEMAINLSNKPEPIFNSPQQLLQFAGAQLDSLVPAAGGGNDYSVHIHNPQFANESKMMRAARDKQELARMRNGGRPF